MALAKRIQFPAGPRLIDGSDLNSNADLASFSAGTGIVAKAGGGQTSATQLVATINRVTTCATNADSVKLPTSAPGMIVWIINDGAASLQVYGTSPDTINGVATGTGVAQAAGISASYMCPVAGRWSRVLSA